MADFSLDAQDALPGGGWRSRSGASNPLESFARGAGLLIRQDARNRMTRSITLAGSVDV
jgi:hypothetical protein